MTMTAAERTAYEAWVTARPNRHGSALLNAYLDGRRDLLDDHRNMCHTGCDWCLDLRQWGECSSCHTDPVEAVGPDDLSRCCGSRVLLNPGDRAEHDALTREENTERAFDRILHDDPWSPR